MSRCAVLTAVFSLHRNLKDIESKGIQCLFWRGYLLVFTLSEAYLHNSQVIAELSLPTGYHDRQSGSASLDALFPVAKCRPAFRAREYWESVWDAREWREGSAAFQTGMDVESILSARGVRRKWPSICWQGKASEFTVSRLIIAGLACWGSVWCNWVEMDGLPEVLIVTGSANWSNQIHMSAYKCSLSSASRCTPNPQLKKYSYT